MRPAKDESMTDRHDKSSSSPFMRFDLETTPLPFANDDSFAIAAWPAALRRGGSAGHAGATANLKLTLHLDHSAGLIRAGPQPARQCRPSCAFNPAVVR